MLTLAHEFLLLSLHDEDGTSLCPDDFLRNACVSAAFVAELMFRDRLVAVEANRFALRPGPRSGGVMGQIEEALEGRKPAKLDAILGWTRGFWGTWDLEDALRRDLVALGVLRREQDRFLFIPYRTRHPAADMGPELAIRQRLRAHIDGVTAETPPTRDDALIGLLRAGKLLGQVWRAPELERRWPVIEERTRRVPIGRDAKQLADSHRAAAMAATTAAVS